MAAHKIVKIFFLNLILLILCLAPVKAATGLSLGQLTLKKEPVPQLHFSVKNTSPDKTPVWARLTISDKLSRQEEQIFSGLVANLDSNQEQYLSFDWENPWRGFGLVQVQLEVWPAEESREKQTETLSFALLPPIITGLSLISLLAVGGLGGKLIFTRLV